MNRFNRIFIGSCLTLASFTALAQDAPQINTSGNAFFAQCKPLNPSYSGCVFYVMGLTDGLQMLNATLEHMNTRRMFCLPSGAVTGEQTIDMMIGYLQRNPEQRDYPTAVILTYTFREAFPCR